MVQKQCHHKYNGKQGAGGFAVHNYSRVGEALRRHNSGQIDFVTVNYRAKPNLNWKGFLCYQWLLMALNWKSVLANVLLFFFPPLLNCFSFALEISLNRTLQIYELLPQAMRVVVQRMLEKIAFGPRDAEDNKEILKIRIIRKGKSQFWLLLGSKQQDLVLGLTPHRNSPCWQFSLPPLLCPRTSHSLSGSFELSKPHDCTWWETLPSSHEAWHLWFTSSF